MKFASPAILWTLFIVPVLALLWVLAERRARQLVQKLVAARLRSQLVGEVSGRVLRLLLLLGGLTLALLALARPQWGEVESESKGRGRDVIIIVDVSRSMLATDLPPTRLQRAKLAAEDLVRQLPADRIGLVAFAGSAFLQAPVTSDHSAVLSAIRELDPEIIPMQGTNVSGALQCANEAFDRSEGGQRAIVLITDGEDLEADAVALSKEMSAKMRIFTVGVGSAEGAVLTVPSPRGGTEYIRDADGNVVQSKLDEGRLLQIAEAGGGFYTHLLSGPAEMRHIAQEGINHMEEHEVTLQKQTHAVDRYQWPLGGALLLLAAGLFIAEKPKRSTANILALVALLLSFEWTVTPSAQAAATLGQNLYHSGNYEGAQKAFGDELKGDPHSPQRAFNFGVAAYKNKKWAEAIDAFGKALASQDPVLRSRAEYNLANTLVEQARQGRRGQDHETLEQSIAHYEESLKRDPNFEDARANRDYVKRLLEQKKQQEQQGDDSKKDKNKDKNKDDKKKDKNKGDKQEEQDDKDGDSKEEKQDSGDKKDGDEQGKQEGKQEGKEDGKQGQEGKQGQNKGDKQGQDTAQNGQQPEPVEEKAGEQKERGDLKDAPTVDNPGKGDKQEKDAEKEAQMAQGGNGKMTREQAAALMEALRSEDRRVQVWAPEKKEGKGVEPKKKTW